LLVSLWLLPLLPLLWRSRAEFADSFGILKLLGHWLLFSSFSQQFCSMWPDLPQFWQFPWNLVPPLPPRPEELLVRPPFPSCLRFGKLSAW
jgi:hypothetical protein